jgi:hypothetical protein
MKLTPRNTLLAGGALILLVNALALGGVYLNRSGEPESRLRLSERELGLPWGWSRGKENSGLALGLTWRVNEAHAISENFVGGAFGYSGGTPEWLDQERMQALGFDTAPVAESFEGRRRFERQQRREVLLVLELAGPAWQKALARAGDNAARHEAAARANADSKEFADKARRARELLKAEEESNSRLFAIDAGLDLAALRAKYPDRGRFLILKAHVRPRLDSRERKTWVTGYVSELAVPTVNVPHALRPGLEPVLRDTVRTPVGTGRRFEATLAVGRRLEPWIEAVAVPATPSR